MTVISRSSLAAKVEEPSRCWCTFTDRASWMRSSSSRTCWWSNCSRIGRVSASSCSGVIVGATSARWFVASTRSSAGTRSLGSSRPCWMTAALVTESEPCARRVRDRARSTAHRAPPAPSPPRGGPCLPFRHAGEALHLRGHALVHPRLAAAGIECGATLTLGEHGDELGHLGLLDSDALRALRDLAP